MSLTNTTIGTFSGSFSVPTTATWSSTVGGWWPSAPKADLTPEEEDIVAGAIAEQIAAGDAVRNTLKRTVKVTAHGMGGAGGGTGTVTTSAGAGSLYTSTWTKINGSATVTGGLVSGDELEFTLRYDET